MCSSESKLLSVVVPVYNVEKYLRDCTGSIQAQTFSDFECILVDDGSTDSSGRICDEIAANDQRFHVIHKKNGGLSDARNAGLRVIAGKYVSFIDSDDWIEPDMFQTMLDVAEKNNLDVVCCNVQTVDDKTHEIGSRIELCAFCGDNDVVNWHTSQILFQALKNISAWNKLYSVSLLREIHACFPVGARYEDVIFWTNTFFHAKRVGCIAKPFYNYRISRAGSIVQEKDYRALVQSYNDMICVLEKYEVLKIVKDDLIATLVFKLVYCLVLSQKRYRSEFFYGMQKLLKKSGMYSFHSNNNILVRFFVWIYSLFARMPYPLFCICCIPVFLLGHFSFLVSFRKKRLSSF